MTTRLPVKGVLESVVLTFDYSREATDVSAPSIGVTFPNGSPAGSPDPTAILDGLPEVAGATVLQRVSNGVQADYLLQCTVNTSDGDILTLGGLLPVRNKV